MEKLTVKQQRFADSYIKNGNATQSYIEAGYSATNENIAGVEGHKLLRNPKILRYIKERTDKLESDKIADIKEIREFWTSVFRSEQYEMKDRLKSSELLGKTQGAFIGPPTALALEEQKARIAALKAKANIDKRNKDIKVTFLGNYNPEWSE